jgi:proteic killer suppression protein
MERDDPAGLPPGAIERIRDILSFLQEMADPEEVRSIPGWRAHLLGGDRQGAWRLTVSRNWRITYRIDPAEGEIVDLDYEDYH